MRQLLVLVLGFILLPWSAFGAVSLSERDWQILKALARNGGSSLTVGTALPATCTTNALFFDSDGGTDSDLFVCVATNTWAAVGSSTPPLQTVFEAGNTISTALPLTPFIVGNGIDYWKIYYDPTGGLRLSCVFAGVEGACNYDQNLSAGFSAGIRSSGGIDIFRAVNDTLAATFGGQIIASGSGIEYTESDTNPTCGAGNFNTFADTSENNLVDCIAGVRVPRTGELTIRKTSDESVSSANTGTTLQNDDVLLFPVAANSTYTFKAFLRYSGATTGDLKFTFALPASAVGEKSSVHAPIGATSCSNTSTTIVTNDITQTDANVGAVGTGAGNLCSLVIEGTVVTAGTAGNVTLQWAQVASDATNTTIHANSWLTYRRIP